MGEHRFLYRGTKYNIFGLILKTSYVTQTLNINYRGTIDPRATFVYCLELHYHFLCKTCMYYSTIYVSVKQQIEIYWEEAWIEEKQTKSTLKFLNLQHPLFGNSHQVWKTVPKKTQHGSKENGSKSEITDRNVYA